MISPHFFVESLRSKKIDFFTGVPDSLLKDICAYITDHIPSDNNIITTNEGSSVGLAAGYYLATGNIPVVYMQNSGLGNAINPLVSLIDKDVYNIPILLLIGWRGEPDIKDEPQHIKQGKITLSMLESIDINYTVLSQDETGFITQLKLATEYMKKTNEPFAFVIRKGTFENYKSKLIENSPLTLVRENAIQIVASSLEENDIIVSTTGMISRELFEYREMNQLGHQKDFLTVGSMGHASQIAFGIALQNKNRKVYCFDGDGAMLMHLGSLAVIGSFRPKNFIHIVFNNGAHDSVGGQPTVGLQINLPLIAKSCGYETVFSISDSESLEEILDKIKEKQGPIFLEIKVKKGSRVDLGRPTTTPIQNKIALMNFLNNND